MPEIQKYLEAIAAAQRELEPRSRTPFMVKPIDGRPEGLYITTSPGAVPGAPHNLPLVTVEQVHGDTTMDRIIMTVPHCHELVEELLEVIRKLS